MATANHDGININTLITHDVIIAGAGPVGLFLACELALAKCTVLVLEKAKDPRSPLKRLPFGIRGLSAPTIEALYRRDLLRELEVHKRFRNPHKTSDPVQGPRRQGGHFAGIPFLDGNIDTAQWRYRLPSSPETNLLSEMEEMESVLARRAEVLGVTIKRGLAITDFQQTADGVRFSQVSNLWKANGLWVATEAVVLFARRAVLNSLVRSQSLPATLLRLTLSTRRSYAQAVT
jgi:2-polyprenyl-6-methoxyphenol hydroxylase-like FAD-dependent oxidoreductase